MKNRFNKMMDTFVWFTDMLSALFLAATFAIVLLNVILRYGFHSGLAWSEEASRYLFAVTVFMGFIQITRQREHYKVDFFPNSLPKGARRICYVIQDVIIIGLLGIIADGAAKNVILRINNRTPAMGLPEWIPYGIILFSSIMMILFMLTNTVSDILGTSKEVSLGDSTMGEEGEAEC